MFVRLAPPLPRAQAPVRLRGAAHAYLGAVEAAPAAQLDSKPASLPLLELRDVVLFPGESMPLLLLSAGEQRLLREAVASDGLVGVLCAGARVGTAARVTRVGVAEGTALARGEWRFSVDRFWAEGEGEGLRMADVRPLRDCAPLRLPRLGGRRRLRPGAPGHAAVPLPRQLLRGADERVLAVRAARVLAARFEWGGGAEGRGVVPSARRPDELSHWLCANLPLRDRQAALEAAGAAARLRLVLAWLDDAGQTALLCVECGRQVSRQAQLFAMSMEGPVNAYVNPHGVVHQTVTLRELAPGAALLVGEPSTESSWFDGYAWTIAVCLCGAHLGWLFTSVSSDGSPEAFWGLRRGGLRSGSFRPGGVDFEEGVGFAALADSESESDSDDEDPGEGEDEGEDFFSAEDEEDDDDD